MIKKILLLSLIFSISGCQAVQIDSNGKKNDFSIQTFILKKDMSSPTVIIAHGCDGANNREYHRWGSVLNSWGYNAVLVDSFSKRGISTLCNRGALLVTFSRRASDIIEVSEWLETQSWHNKKTGLLGFSMGGTTVFSFEDKTGLHVWGGIPKDYNLKILAGVSYYPQCRSIKPPPTPDFPTMIHFAMKDISTPPDSCDYKNLTDKNYTIVLHETAGHGFDQNYPQMYDRKSDLRSRKLTKEFFDRHLKN